MSGLPFMGIFFQVFLKVRVILVEPLQMIYRKALPEQSLRRWRIDRKGSGTDRINHGSGKTR